MCDWSGRKLTAELFASLCETIDCESVKSLKVKDNLLKSITSESIARFVSLEIAFFSENQLASLPPAFQSLDELVELILTENRFKKVPEFLPLNLVALYVADNRIADLP